MKPSDAKLHELARQLDGLQKQAKAFGVFVNDRESGLWNDIMRWLEDLAPAKPEYEHHRTGEDNADAHLKRMLLGHQVTMPITNGKLDVGPWERVHYGEFDGRRPKRIVIKVMGV